MKDFLIAFIVLAIILVLIGAIFVFLQEKPEENRPLLELKIPTIMKISSSAFEHNTSIPSQYTCDGQDVSPPLGIRDIPENTQSLALIVDDPDAPGGTFVHWVVWNIPFDVTAIAENTVPAQAVQGKSDFGREDYGGPCPPSGSHRYFFRLYALDTKLDLPQGSDKTDVEQAMEGHILDKAELIGLYQR